MYRIEIEHEGHWLTGRDSGIDDLGGEFRTQREARETIKACADTERTEGREMPRTRIVSMATVAARALGSLGGRARTEAQTLARRANGAKPVKPGSRPRGRPAKLPPVLLLRRVGEQKGASRQNGGKGDPESHRRGGRPKGRKAK